MNRGSAWKWCELLKSDLYEMNDGWGLRWHTDRYSPVGVLEDFITKQWKDVISYSGCYANIDGNHLIASKECLKKTKAKTDLEVVDDLWYHLRDIDMLVFMIEFNQETL